ncbi:MAG: hypothetical protein R2849_18985 [Thermomicrobiales bacterium]
MRRVQAELAHPSEKFRGRGAERSLRPYSFFGIRQQDFGQNVASITHAAANPGRTSASPDQPASAGVQISGEHHLVHLCKCVGIISSIIAATWGNT